MAVDHDGAVGGATSTELGFGEIEDRFAAERSDGQDEVGSVDAFGVLAVSEDVAESVLLLKDGFDYGPAGLECVCHCWPEPDRSGLKRNIRAVEFGDCCGDGEVVAKHGFAPRGGVGLSSPVGIWI